MENKAIHKTIADPEQEPTPEQIFDSMTEEEQEGFIDYCVYVEGFNKAIDEIPQGIYEEPTELIRERFNISKKAPLYLMIVGYAAGVNHGIDLACDLACKALSEARERPAMTGE